MGTSKLAALADFMPIHASKQTHKSRPDVRTNENLLIVCGYYAAEDEKAPSARKWRSHYFWKQRRSE